MKAPDIIRVILAALLFAFFMWMLFTGLKSETDE